MALGRGSLEVALQQYPFHPQHPDAPALSGQKQTEAHTLDWPMAYPTPPSYFLDKGRQRNTP